MDTGRFKRFERVTAVEETERGLLATLHGEQLRVDVVRDDVVRVKISRGGAFDESPTFAVCVDPLAEPVAFTVECGDGVVRLRTAALVRLARAGPVPARRPPPRRQRRRRDRRRRRRPPLGVRHAQRRVRGPPPLPPGGRDLRPRREDRAPQPQGRDFTLWNTDVLDPDATAEFTAGRPPDDPRADRTSTEFDPYYVSIPFFYHHAHPAGAMAASFVDNGYRARYDFSAAEEYAFRFEGGQYTEYIFAGPEMPDILARLHVADRPHRAPAAVGARLPPVPLVPTTRRTRSRRSRGATASEDVPCDALWLDIEYMDGYRVFTWDTEAFPDVAGHARAAARAGLPGHHHRRPRGQGRARLPRCSTRRWSATCCAGRRAATSTSARSGPATPRSRTSSPRRARAWWGELNAAHVRSGLAGIWNDMNEPATGAIPPDRMRFDHGRAVARALPQPVRAADGHGHRRRACARRCPTCARSCSPAPASPASSATPPTGWATTWRAGTTCG